MGLCILFPGLCGLKTARVSEMKQITYDICETLAYDLEETENMVDRLVLIETAKAEALIRLKEKGYNPYE